MHQNVYGLLWDKNSHMQHPSLFISDRGQQVSRGGRGVHRPSATCLQHSAVRSLPSKPFSVTVRSHFRMIYGTITRARSYYSLFCHVKYLNQRMTLVTQIFFFFIVGHDLYRIRVRLDLHASVFWVQWPTWHTPTEWNTMYIENRDS